MKCRIVKREEGDVMAVHDRAEELRELTDEELLTSLRESKEELFNLRFQMATGQLDNNRRLQTGAPRHRARSTP